MLTQYLTWCDVADGNTNPSLLDICPILRYKILVGKTMFLGYQADSAEDTPSVCQGWSAMQRWYRASPDFYYLVNLNILTVKVTVTTAMELIASISAGDLLSPDSVLSCLYPDDPRKKTSNAANQYQFNKVGILTLRNYVLDLGHPYL